MTDQATSQLPTTADIIAQCLWAAGITRAFGIPGGEVLALLEGFRRAGISFHLAKHENAAGFMAEGHWHGTGEIPVLVSTLGPGVANAVNVIANAQQDRVPLIFLTGCLDHGLAESFTHQVFDHQAVLRPITKASFRIAPGTERIVLEKALAIAAAGRPGPVHIDIPVNIAESASSARPLSQTKALPHADNDLTEIENALASAQKPLLLAGLDLVIENAAEHLRAFVERTHIPVLTSYKAKGLLPEDSPLSLGAIGLSPRADKIVHALIAQSDLILLAGYDPIEMRQGWHQPWPASKMVIDLVAEDIRHGMHMSTWRAVGPVGGLLARLGRKAPSHRRWQGQEPEKARLQLRAAFHSPADWGPHAVFDEIRKRVPADIIATADSGSHRILLSQMWTCTMPRTLLQSSGLCTMGCALPLAIGAAMANGRHTLCFVGDAGLEMVIGELATLRDMHLPVIIVVLVDRQLGLIALKQQNSGLPETGVSFGATDFPAVAAAFGGSGIAVADRSSLAQAIADAMERRHFSVIACEIGPDAYRGAF